MESEPFGGSLLNGQLNGHSTMHSEFYLDGTKLYKLTQCGAIRCSNATGYTATVIDTSATSVVSATPVDASTIQRVVGLWKNESGSS